MSNEDSARLMDVLTASPAVFGPQIDKVLRLETHISWVLLAGEFAWKFKKPVNFGFLDFSTLERRRHFCEEELRLNRRMARELYLDVVRVTGSTDAPVLNGPGEAIEYAVRMRRFRQEQLLSRVLADGRLTTSHIERLAETIAEFHTRIPKAAYRSPFGNPESVMRPFEANFAALAAAEHAMDSISKEKLRRVQAWGLQEFELRRDLFEHRQRDGFVRECHGDMHLGNMVLREDDSIAIFDGIEFDESLRWIDVASEIAFLTMDLEDRNRPDFSRRFLSTYLERTGDHGLLGVLRFYQVYRATVRAKVASLRLGQPDVAPQEIQDKRREMAEYLSLADRLTQPHRPLLVLTCGVSGSGKSTISQCLVDQLGAVRVRSDVERKRLAGLAPESASHSTLHGQLYTPEMSKRTYDRLHLLAETILDSGFSVVADATFLHASERSLFRRLAEDREIPFLIVNCHAPLNVLKERIQRRAASGRDASEATLAVLQHQLRTAEPPESFEAEETIAVDTSHEDAEAQMMQELRRRTSRTDHA